MGLRGERGGDPTREEGVSEDLLPVIYGGLHNIYVSTIEPMIRDRRWTSALGRSVEAAVLEQRQRLGSGASIRVAVLGLHVLNARRPGSDAEQSPLVGLHVRRVRLRQMPRTPVRGMNPGNRCEGVKNPGTRREPVHKPAELGWCLGHWFAAVRTG